MHLYEERIRAVKLHIKLGKRTGPIIRQLGCPTKNSLKGWHREYERNRDLQVRYARSWEKYTAERMQIAVQHCLDNDRRIASTLRALGYQCRGLLTDWIDELHPQARRRLVERAPNVLYRPEIKNAVVVKLCTRTNNAQFIAQSVGMCRPTLYNWKNYHD